MFTRNSLSLEKRKLMSVRIDPSWKELLADEFEKPYFHDLKSKLYEMKQAWTTIYPPGDLIFNAFNLTPVDNVNVVILGQDPYHGPWQAHGLCFSVPDWVRPPPSLGNMFKEIQENCWWDIPTSWNLTHRAEQWVFLLNAILTVTARTPASHKDLWWQYFTDAVMKKLSDTKTWLIFLLRWNFARQKKVLIDGSKHIILEAPHPSPFSVHKWFFWCKHFSQTNQYLQMQGKEPIKWFG